MDWKDEEVEQAWTGARGMDVGSREATRAIMSTAVELVAARGGTMTADGEHVFEATTEDGGRVWVESTGEWGHEGGNISWALDALAAHVVALRATQGARVAVLEGETERLRKSADELQRQRDSSNESLEHMREQMQLAEQRANLLDDDVRNLRERLTAAEDGNRELVRRAQQAESERDQWQREHGSAMRRWKAEKDNAETWRKRVEAAADEFADIGAGECGRLDIVTRVRMLKARCAALSAAGQVPSAHVDTTGAPEEEVSGLCERSYGPSEICGNCDPRDMPEREPHAFKPGHGTRDACRYTSVVNGQLCGWERSAHRYPCSATCTHDDADTPSHAERVRLMSGAVSKVTGLEGTITERGPAEAPVCSRCGRRFPGAQAPHGGEPCDVPLAHPERVKERSEAFKKTAREPDSSLSVTEAACYEQGAEAMRAACWEAVEGQLQACGVYTESPMWNVIKAAIEGAAP